VRGLINDFLWSDETGLPETYSDDEIKIKTEAVFAHVYRVYPALPSPFYNYVAS
jgi:type I restriction enzyme R subunit